MTRNLTLVVFTGFFTGIADILIRVGLNFSVTPSGLKSQSTVKYKFPKPPQGKKAQSK